MRHGYDFPEETEEFRYLKPIKTGDILEKEQELF